MNLRLVSAAVLLAAAAVFFLVGFRSSPRNTTYIVMGPVFVVFAAVRLRRGRRP